MLEALLALQAPEGGWKLIVADNGSRDATSAVLQRYSNLLPLTIVNEPAAGKNRALNRAISEIEGDLTVLTDDDVIPDPDWLIQLQRAAAAHPEATVFGGTVIPLWPGTRPPFISQRAVDFSILYALNEQPTGWCEAGVIFGPNMAVRTSVFREEGFTFAEDVGPDNSRRAYVMGGESDFVLRVMAAGHRAWFAADARVQHMVRPNQLTEPWILQRYYLRGLQYRREGRGARGLAAKQAVCSAGAKLARLFPPSWFRLWILSRDQFFAGFFAEAAVPSEAAGVDHRRPVNHS